MGKLMLVGAGAALGILGVSRLRRATRSYGPEGLHARATTWTDAIRDFAADVREGMVEREEELRAALGADASGSAAQLGEAHELLEHPTSPRP